LALDKNIFIQINKLQRDLFALINVREFSDEAQFVDPSLSFIIPQVNFIINIAKKLEFVSNYI
jgi:hypothetical protein